VVEKVALGQVFGVELRFYSVNIITAICHFRLHADLTRRTEGRSFGNLSSPKALSFRKSGIIGQKKMI
jgi:hypothetical protein